MTMQYLDGNRSSRPEPQPVLWLLTLLTSLILTFHLGISLLLFNPSLCVQAGRRVVGVILAYRLQYSADPNERIAKELRPDNPSVVYQPALANRRLLCYDCLLPPSHMVCVFLHHRGYERQRDISVNWVLPRAARTSPGC